jgi:CubicO group peptidase (beta-lactamase class C family)
MVLQQLLIDLLQISFPEIMKKTVLSPLGMIRSTYEQPLPDGIQNNASSGHLANGRLIREKHNIHPEMAAAGLWTTPTDLCRFAVFVMRAWAGKSGPILSQDMTRTMLCDHGNNRGLGFRVFDSGTDFLIDHSGSNAGFRCVLVAYPEKGQGMAIMTNGENGSLLIEEILGAISVEYGWRHFRSKTAILKD